ncbi:DUF6528 family protein [Sphingomonas sp. CFBP 8760]|uniref:DUF6528 family protein n=1 Tax=Sphingomonas sp. CFBP 8760 TaxID=2775282 RepID=UPI001780CA59|nr:DUF6528 family protein [Sphingomonas sp. CFBP 8760]MBD8548996.1 hypothetical protein [Sphingomonas sp. CFBP 8760]
MQGWYAALGIVVTVAGAGPAGAAERLYACGDDEIREYRLSGGGVAGEVWRWRAADAVDLPESYRKTLLAKIDDCKAVDGGRSILVTASTGGVVLIDRASGRVSFRATAPMAHSADLLPGGLIAVALSIHQHGDRLELYDRNRSETPLLHLPLPSGHGAVWDARRRRLFVLSHDLIQAYRIAGTGAAPKLLEASRWMLPGRRDGHDLSRRPDGRYLVTTDDGVWTFDPEGKHSGGGMFAALPALNPKLRVKAVGMAGDGMNGRLAWVQAEESWWAKGFTIARADGSDPVRVPVTGLHLYKVRWIE